MNRTKSSDDLPAGFEIVDDMPMHRFERNWTVGHKPRALRPTEKSSQSQRQNRSDRA